MAAVNPYMDEAVHPPPVYPQVPSGTSQAGSRAFKRKRDQNGSHISAAGPAGARGGPNPRRSLSHQNPTEDPNNAFTEQSMRNANSSAQFDLSALQSHQAQNQAHNSQQQPSAQPSIGSTAAAALNYTMTVPPHPAADFAHQPTIGADNNSGLSEFQTINSPPSGVGRNHGAGATTPPQSVGYGTNTNITSPPSDSAYASNQPHSATSAQKPSVGTDQWLKQRKDNHKEVERRRRETINEGINELAKIVPGCEKNKGSILARAVQYIQKLQDDASSNIDKWTFEKLVTEQAIGDLSGKLDRAHAMVAALKRDASLAGVDVEAVEVRLSEELQAAQQQHYQQQQQSQSGGNGNGNIGSSTTDTAAAVAAASRAQAAPNTQLQRGRTQQPRMDTANMGQAPARDEAAEGSEGKST